MTWNNSVCVVCGNRLNHHARCDAKTCSANCRKTLSRRKDRVKAMSRNMIANLGELNQLARKNVDLQPEIEAQLLHIRGQITDVLYWLNCEAVTRDIERADPVAAVQASQKIDPTDYLTVTEALAFSKMSKTQV